MRAIILCVIVCLVGGCARRVATSPMASQESTSTLSGKTILMVIAHRNFRDEELAKPKAIFEKAGAKVRVASSDMSQAKGMMGLTVKPDLLLKDAKASDYNVIVFIGGSGASEYWNDAKAHAIAKEMYGQGKIVAAICFAPVTLANAGLLTGKKATAWPSLADKLESKGALYTKTACVTDGLIITADGPSSAEEFANAIVKAMQ